MLNWIIWNRTVFDIEIVYLGRTKLIEIEPLPVFFKDDFHIK